MNLYVIVVIITRNYEIKCHNNLLESEFSKFYCGKRSLRNNRGANSSHVVIQWKNNNTTCLQRLFFVVLTRNKKAVRACAGIRAGLRCVPAKKRGALRILGALYIFVPLWVSISEWTIRSDDSAFSRWFVSDRIDDLWRHDLRNFSLYLLRNNRLIL